MLEFKPRLTYHGLALPPARTDQPSVFAFSLAKAGSTLMYDMLRELAPHVGLTYYSPEDALFAANVGPNNRPSGVDSVFLPNGYCYGGFRAFPSYPVPTLHLSQIIFLMRDPRDMAVSLYYSMLKSHTVPEAADDDTIGARAQMLSEREQIATLGIDAFVSRRATANYQRMMEGYVAQGFLWRPNVTIFRYEDVIFDKVQWLHDICEAFGWDLPSDLLEEVAERYDERPAEMRPDQHVRTVTPGDHRTQLSPAAIENLNQAFAEYMRWFDYT